MTSPADPFALMSLGQVILVDDDLELSRRRFSNAFGLYAHDESPGVIRLHRDRIDMRVVGPETQDAAASGYLEAHGPGVAVIALEVADPQRAHEHALSRGATEVPAYPGRAFYGRDAIATPGGYVHVFTEHASSCSRDHSGNGQVAWDSGLMNMDHFAVCLPPGDLEVAVAFYESVLGFSTTFKEQVRVGRQGMNTKVVQNPLRDVTFTIIEPDTTREPGQIDEYLAKHGGPGVQHIAFASSDALSTVRGMRERGVPFLRTPDAYYDRLPERLPVLAHVAEDLRRQHILVDEDHSGQLYQIFTHSEHPRGTLFYEVIERLGATTFGSGNITALYEAVEAERAG
jgi:4-hydroxymandelate synthase